MLRQPLAKFNGDEEVQVVGQFGFVVERFPAINVGPDTILPQPDPKRGPFLKPF